MTKDILRCYLCGRKLVYIKETWLCVVCQAFIIYELNTPATLKEQNDWINRNLSVGHNGKKN